MPISKKRKKKGKPVKGTLHVDPDKESNITLQDLINAVAYQDFMAAPGIEDEQKENEDER